MLDARQFGLKMIANVTYSYSSASFSGRMPCVEIADSIVQTARETLERVWCLVSIDTEAIRTVESHPTWNAKVVYGDTDRYRKPERVTKVCLSCWREQQEKKPFRLDKRSLRQWQLKTRNLWNSSLKKCITLASWWRRNVTLGSNTNLLNKRNLFSTPKELKQSDETLVQPLPR